RDSTPPPRGGDSCPPSLRLPPDCKEAIRDRSQVWRTSRIRGIRSFQATHHSTVRGRRTEAATVSRRRPQSNHQTSGIGRAVDHSKDSVQLCRRGYGSDLASHHNNDTAFRSMAASTHSTCFSTSSTVCHIVESTTVADPRIPL